RFPVGFSSGRTGTSGGGIREADGSGVGIRYVVSGVATRYDVLMSYGWVAICRGKLALHAAYRLHPAITTKMTNGATLAMNFQPFFSIISSVDFSSPRFSRRVKKARKTHANAKPTSDNRTIFSKPFTISSSVGPIHVSSVW